MSKRYAPTDDILGNLFIQKHRHEYIWMYESWYRYENGVWSRDEVGPYKDMWRVLIENKDKGIKPSSDKVASILKYAALWLRPGEEQIDTADYINLRNGLYNLRTQELEAHRKETYMTSQLPFDFDAKASCPSWERFIDGVLVNENFKPDDSLITVVQQAFGYSLTASTDHRVSFWLVGGSGTGKSTLQNVLQDLAGESHAAIDMDFLTKNEYQFAHLPGKRLVTFTEPSEGMVLDDGAYKRLVSQDTITGRHPHGRPFQFVPEFKLWGSMNSLPKVRDRSDAVYNRVIIIPMNRVVPESERDIRLIEKLRAELPGVFNWAMEGLQSLRRNGKFSMATASREAREEWKIDNDTEAAFIEDECLVQEGTTVAARAIYSKYRDWCRYHGYHAKSERSVAREWVRLGATKSRSSSGVFYKGIGLKGDESMEVPF